MIRALMGVIGKINKALVAAILAFAVACTLVPSLAFGAIDLTYDYPTLDGNGVSDPTTKVTVSKLDEDSHDAVKGATLAILSADGKELVRWSTTDQSKYFDRSLNAGVPLNIETEYILREISAPEGYAKAEDTHFVIDKYGNVEIISGGDAESVGKYALNLYDTRLDAYRDEIIYREGERQGDGSTLSAAGSLTQTGDPLQTIMMALATFAGLALVVVLILATRFIHQWRAESD